MKWKRKKSGASEMLTQLSTLLGLNAKAGATSVVSSDAQSADFSSIFEESTEQSAKEDPNAQVLSSLDDSEDGTLVETRDVSPQKMHRGEPHASVELRFQPTKTEEVNRVQPDKSEEIMGPSVGMDAHVALPAQNGANIEPDSERRNSSPLPVVEVPRSISYAPQEQAVSGHPTSPSKTRLRPVRDLTVEQPKSESESAVAENRNQTQSPVQVGDGQGVSTAQRLERSLLRRAEPAEVTAKDAFPITSAQRDVGPLKQSERASKTGLSEAVRVNPSAIKASQNSYERDAVHGNDLTFEIEEHQRKNSFPSISHRPERSVRAAYSQVRPNAPIAPHSLQPSEEPQRSAIEIDTKIAFVENKPAVQGTYFERGQTIEVNGKPTDKPDIPQTSSSVSFVREDGQFIATMSSSQEPVEPAEQIPQNTQTQLRPNRDVTSLGYTLGNQPKAPQACSVRNGIPNVSETKAGQQAVTPRDTPMQENSTAPRAERSDILVSMTQLRPRTNQLFDSPIVDEQRNEKADGDRVIRQVEGPDRSNRDTDTSVRPDTNAPKLDTRTLAGTSGLPEYRGISLFERSSVGISDKAALFESDAEVQAEMNLVESRISASQTSPSSPTSPIHRISHGAVMRQISEQIPRLAEGQIEVRLNPEELGRVRIQLLSVEHGMSIHIQAERQETIDLLRRNIDQLASELKDAGYEATSFSFGNSNTPGQDKDGGTGEGQSAASTTQELEANQNEPNAIARLTPSMDGLDIRL